MTKTIRLAMAFLAVAASAATASAAEGSMKGNDRAAARFERTDADSSGDVSFEEFTAVMSGSMEGADTDGDGKMTVGELAVQIEKNRAERMARRMVERFDTDGDGALTTAEIEARQKKFFAWLDRNDDGTLQKDEMPSRNGKGRRH
jgi:Ca2+-binding EF-hand superfamily protein